MQLEIDILYNIMLPELESTHYYVDIYLSWSSMTLKVQNQYILNLFNQIYLKHIQKNVHVLYRYLNIVSGWLGGLRVWLSRDLNGSAVETH